MLGQLSAAISTSRSMPAPKCGMMNGTFGAVIARRATPSGSPRRRSKRLGSPSLRRTPTDSTPQCTNTAVPGCIAATCTISCTRSSCSGTWCMAGNRQMPRNPSSSIARRERATGSGDEGSSMKKPTKRSGCFATAAATDVSSPGILAISAARRTPCASSSRTHVSARVYALPGASQSRSPHTSSASRLSSSSSAGSGEGARASLRPRCRASVARNCVEKKWQWASLICMLHHARFPPPHDRQDGGDEYEADREPQPEAGDAPAEHETEHVARRQAEHPVTDDIRDHRRPRVAGAAKDSGGDHLHAVEQLECGRDGQQPDPDLYHARIV